MILGSGGHAKVVIDILRAMGGHEVVGCIYDDTDPSRIVAGVPIIDGADRIETLADEGLSVAIGLGGWTDNTERAALFTRAADLNLDIVTAIHPRAYIAPSASVGRGSVVFPGATVCVDATIGENVIVATNSSIDHESVIGDHVLISAGVVIGSHVSVGHGTLLAIGATVASYIDVGDRSLIAAGSVVVDDVPPGTSVRGLPARPI